MSASRDPSRARRLPACVLTIAGSDSNGGAGIQADQRTITALGGFAATAVTTVTAQHGKGVVALESVSPRVLGAQVRVALEYLPIAAIKIGLLPGRAAIRVVAEILSEYRKIPLVVDPVIGSTSGATFLRGADLKWLRERLLPVATLVTPNWPEATRLTGIEVDSVDAAENAARHLIADTNCNAVLVKGGHSTGVECVDVLVTRKGARRFAHRRIQTSNTHGTGCVLSAAIATKLAQQNTLATSVKQGIDFLQSALKRGRKVDWGDRGPALF